LVNSFIQYDAAHNVCEKRVLRRSLHRGNTV